MTDILVDETKILEILRRIPAQTTDPRLKRETVEKQLVDVLKTSTQSGVIQRKNDYYCDSIYVEDVKKIVMDDKKWFTPSQISVGSQSISSAVSIKEAESSVNSVGPLQVNCPTAVACRQKQRCCQLPKTMIRNLTIQIVKNTVLS
ncbi:uncharacterized protein LOC124460567 [Drosophila willistoni]|uniref:uncharacterized protein LOC124460567 n=1 Tax=Drosophila willistoni TaxID=7260 RepID=UPI00017D9BAF|nr:uncharacterized protein LOC124460567 [Drosophila willistoni]